MIIFIVVTVVCIVCAIGAYYTPDIISDDKEYID